MLPLSSLFSAPPSLCRTSSLHSSGQQHWPPADERWPGVCRTKLAAQSHQGASKDGEGCLRIIDVIPQHVEGVVHSGPEVQVVQVLGEVLPPVHIQQVAGELVKALQLCTGWGWEKGERGKGGEEKMASCDSRFKAQSWQELLLMRQKPLGSLRDSSLLRFQITRSPFPIRSRARSFNKSQHASQRQAP